ncbi:MAG TPA: PaaX family transcriptional regulator C-terminal domain-containing protein [Acidimicrobiia bacterium]
MKLRSIVFDLFGEYIRYDGGEIGLRALVELLAPFGISEDVVRVLMARLRKEGWFESSRVGRQSRYSLTSEGWHLLDTGRERIFERPPEPWPGEWCMAIYSIPESARASRDRLRKLLSWLGFGPLAASAWISPHDRRDQVSEAWKDESDGRLQLLMARSGGLDEDREMAARCWDLEALNDEYAEFLTTWEPRVAAWQRSQPEGAEALVERTRLIHEYRMFPFKDPGLPPELLPAGWRGRQAHDLFLAGFGLLRAPAVAHYQQVLEATGESGGLHQPASKHTPLVS